MKLHERIAAIAKQVRSKRPARIWLQVDGEFDEVTWCADQINSTDVEYVRLDVVKRLLYEAKK